LESRGLLPLWSQVRAMWLLIWWQLEAYMVVNFRARGITRGTCKLAGTPTLIKKKASYVVIDKASFSNVVNYLAIARLHNKSTKQICFPRWKELLIESKQQSKREKTKYTSLAMRDGLRLVGVICGEKREGNRGMKNLLWCGTKYLTRNTTRVLTKVILAL